MKKFVCLDINNLVHRAKHAIKDYDGIDECVGSILTNIFLTVRMNYERFEGTHIVAFFDSYSWRREFYPEYKANRRDVEVTSEKLEESQIINEVIDNLRNYFEEYTNVTVLHAYMLEADDLIARWVQLHSDLEFFKNIIISGDSDFRQLVTHNTELFDPLADTLYTLHGVYVQSRKQNHRTNGSVELYGQTWKIKLRKKSNEPETLEPDWYLFLKCMRGDTNDNVTTAFPRIRETKLRTAFENKGGLEWNNILNDTWGPDDNRQSVRERYERNRLLIDLSYQPQIIKDLMDETIESAIEPKNKILIGAYFAKFCSKYRLNRLQQQANVITRILTNGY